MHFVALDMPELDEKKPHKSKTKESPASNTDAAVVDGNIDGFPVPKPEPFDDAKFEKEIRQRQREAVRWSLVLQARRERAKYFTMECCLPDASHCFEIVPSWVTNSCANYLQDPSRDLDDEKVSGTTKTCGDVSEMDAFEIYGKKAELSPKICVKCGYCEYCYLKQKKKV
jgi:hypothetical protein